MTTFEKNKHYIEAKFEHLEVVSRDFKNNKWVLTILDKQISKYFQRSFSSIMESYSPGHPETKIQRTKKTCVLKYGVENPSQVKEFNEKASKSMNNAYKLTHWKTNKEINCVGKYEACVVNYLNTNKIDYIWKPMIFTCSNGSKYFVDMYLPEKNIYVEIKGRFFNDALYKWNEFKQAHPNSELWSKSELKLIGIDDRILQYIVPKYIQENRLKIHGRLGKTLSRESKDKIAKSKIGRKRTESHNNLMKSLLSNKITKKSIPLIDQFGNIFANARIAGKFYGIDQSDIKKASVSGKQIKSIIFTRTTWEYLDV